MPLNIPYAGLNRAQLSYDYLHTNSTTHEFLFGAIVELVDNSRDAGAKKINIYTEPDSRFMGGQMLCFLDDGCGMDQSEANAIMNFGFSAKKFDPSMIGQYGNGLKSGAMRIGKDFIVFTKRSSVFTCVFLSRTFHEKEHISEVIVPMPSFTADKKQRIAESEEDATKFETEMELIRNYSPFKTEEELLAQFDKITGPSGTLVVCFNLRLLDTGEPELDFSSDPRDIKLGDPDGRDMGMAAERISLRAYLSVVYKEPHMKIYIQKKKVQTRKILSFLYKPRQYKYMSKNFKSRAEKEVARAKEDANLAEQRLKEANSKLADFENRHTGKVDYLTRVERRQLNDAVVLAKRQGLDASKRAKEKEKSKNDPKPLVFVFGLNLERRAHCGCMIYNNGRLIKMYEKVGPQIEGGVKGLGVVAVVDVPYIVLEPTHNKQDFADGREYRALLKALGDHMEQFWKDLDIASQSGGVPQFWQMYGYTSTDWTSAPTMEKEFVQRRFMSVHQCVQCDECLKWRTVPFKATYIGKEFPENWTCKDNPNNQFNRCAIGEHFERIPEGRLTKGVEDVDAKKARLAKQLEQKQKEMEKLEKQRPVSSSKDAKKIQNERQTSNSPQKRSRQRSPSPPRPKTKADLRKQMEVKEKEKAKAKKEAEKKKEADRKKREEEKKRKEKEEKKRKEQAAARRSSARNAKRVSSSSGEEEEEEKEEEKDDSTVNDKQAEISSTRSPQYLHLRRSANNSPSKQTPVVEKQNSIPATNSESRSSRRRAASPAEETQSSAPAKRTRSDGTPVRAVAESSSAGDSNGSGEVTSTTRIADSAFKEKMESALSERDAVADKYRDIIKYLLPPGWHLDQSQVAEMKYDELMNIDMRGDFYPTYEKNLRSLMDKQKERETKEFEKVKVQLEANLTNLRKNAAVLVQLIKPNSLKKEEETTDAVDAKLEECVKELAE